MANATVTKKSSLKVVREQQPASDNPLVDSSVNQSLDLMRDYAVFLCDYMANDSGDDPGDDLRHGRYLAMRVLLDALEKVGQPEAGKGGAA